MLFVASNSDAPNEQATLSSPQQPSTNGPSCLEFYYNANGKLISKIVFGKENNL